MVFLYIILPSRGIDHWLLSGLPQHPGIFTKVVAIVPTHQAISCEGFGKPLYRMITNHECPEKIPEVQKNIQKECRHGLYKFYTSHSAWCPPSYKLVYKPHWDPLSIYTVIYSYIYHNIYKPKLSHIFQATERFFWTIMGAPSCMVSHLDIARNICCTSLAASCRTTRPWMRTTKPGLDGTCCFFLPGFFMVIHEMFI